MNTETKTGGGGGGGADENGTSVSKIITLIVLQIAVPIEVSQTHISCELLIAFPSPGNCERNGKTKTKQKLLNRSIKLYVCIHNTETRISC